jgi:hypothetical protein
VANGFQVVGFQHSGFQSQGDAVAIDLHAERFPHFQDISKRYIFAVLYAYIPIYTPSEVPELEYPEEPGTDFEFTKPLIPTPTYISPEKRVAKY